MAKQNKKSKVEQTEERATVSVREAGRRGGLATSRTHSKSFYQEIGHRGGAKVAELIKKGKEASQEGFL